MFRQTSSKATDRKMIEVVANSAGLALLDKSLGCSAPAELAGGGRTAELLFKQGKAGAVRDYFDHLAVGGFA